MDEEGDGIFGDAFDYIKHIIGASSKYNNTSRKTLEKFGNRYIHSAIATREVVNKYVSGFMNLVSLGRLNVERDKLGYDNFFHIRLYVRLRDNTLILIEKNEVVMVEKVNTIKGEPLPISFPRDLTLQQLLNNAEQFMGKDFFTYDPYLNNCASFVVSILKANHLWSDKDTAFLFQDVKALADKLPTSHAVGSFITKMGAVFSRVIGKGLDGGVMPITNAVVVDMANESYSKTPTDTDGWRLIAPYTLGVKPFIKGNVIVLAIRGSADMRDVYADLRIVNGSLNKSPRYADDKAFITKLQQQYPQSQYEYYAIGHSLGGAICDLLIDDGFVKEAVSYNPAVELKYYKNTNNHRIYNEDDLLYKMMGQYTTNHEVRKNNLSLFGKFLNISKSGRLKNALQAHKLSNFVGGLKWYV